MLKDIYCKNLGPLENVSWTNLGKINLIIGNNASGKTFLLKALYCAVKTIEGTSRGNNPLKAEEILAERLFWTFQPGKIGLGELVTKGKNSLEIQLHGQKRGSTFSFHFGSSTEKKISTLQNSFSTREQNSIFLPAKEVLSLFHIIKKSRDIDHSFGFDDTYLDLVRALEIEPTMGRNYESFAKSRKDLEQILDGRIVFENNEWAFKKGNSRFSIHTASEGIKKVSILDRLLGNRYLSDDSVVFIDEPESALHPEALTKFMDIVAELARAGIQFFIATHSYFVIKKLHLISKTQKQSIPFLSIGKDKNISYDNLLDGLPENPIIRESIRLYEEEVELSFQ